MSDRKDISDRVLITPEALTAWSVIAQNTVKMLPKHLLQSIGEEVIFLNADSKTLTVSCAIGNGEIAMIIPEGQWRWNTGSAN